MRPKQQEVMRVALMDVVKRKLKVAEALAEGQCGGSYSDACILLSCMISGMAADLWRGEGIDKKRFIEVWARYADELLSPLLVSAPLLVGNLRRDKRLREAETIEALRPKGLGAGYEDLVVTSADVDMSEHEVLAQCPQLTLWEVRAHSYPAAFYQHVRSTLVHEYHPGDFAATWSMTACEARVSYVNVADWSDESDDYDELSEYRQIHYHIPWLIKLVRSIAICSDGALRSTPLPHPGSWWVEGGR
jgi:hypothetical protein